ncbi:hypothetical protein ACHMW5_13650 [Azospirillum melinis]|uniref:hypothetical protein n=1 Tax=Azospirillum melinis TaxID=328839 RepID=UPI00375734C0
MAAALQPVPNARRVGVISHQAPVRQSQDEVTDLGSPETRKKLRPDTLLLMLDRGQLDQPQYDAAVLIRSGYMIRTFGLGVKVASYGERVASRTGDGYQSVWAATIERNYRTWVDEILSQERAIGRQLKGARRPKTDAITDIIISGLTCNEVEGRRRMKNGSVGPMLREALDTYNDIRWRRGKFAPPKAA